MFGGCHGIRVVAVVVAGGLATALDGGDDNDRDGEGDGDGSQNDVLTASGTERVYGGIGDDGLTLEDRAVGMGGAGDDTIRAQDEAVGYGLKGDDSLTAAGKATIRGGADDDWLSAEDEAAAYGDAGHDVITVAGDAHGDGGVGNDTLTASGEAVIQGGDGDDVLIYQDSGRISAPEAGDDIYVLHHASAGGASLGFEYNSTDAGDRVAMHLGTDDLSNFTFRRVSGSNDGGDGHDRLSGDGDLYGGAGNDLIEPEADWAVENGADRYGGNTSGGAGDDTIRGGTSDDTITGSVAFHGDAGNDDISTAGQTSLYGGDGDDILTLTEQVEDQQASNAATLAGQAFGGAGNDVILQRSIRSAKGQTL